ncbi:hypothetical protein EON66_05940, partial [archaeon]
RSSSIDLEKSMISKLKMECGAQFTSKLEGMFKDVDVSRDLMDKFGAFVRLPSSTKPPFDLHVHVLTSSYWPAYAKATVNVPRQVCTRVRTRERVADDCSRCLHAWWLRVPASACATCR